MCVYLLCGFLALTGLAYAQRPTDPKNTYHRVVGVVPIVGAGTAADPKRPMYAPWPPVVTRDSNAIIAFSYEPSDDGRFALVEFVARNRAALQHILADRSGNVKAFEKGNSKRGDVEKELKKYKKNFDIEKFGAVLP